MRLQFRLVAVIGCVLVLAGCAGGPAAAPTSAPPAATTAPTAAAAQPTAGGQAMADDLKPLAEPYKIQIAVVNNLFGTTFWSAIEKGIFQKHGIQASSKSYASGQEASKALSGGDVQVGTSAMNNFQNEINSGVKQTAIYASMGNSASLINDKPLAIIAHPDSGIRAGHPEDLKGKTVGLSMGGTAELYLRAVLKKANVDAKDVKMVNIPQGNWVSSLKSKNVDAISGWEPYITVATQDVKGSLEVQRSGGYFGYIIFGLVTTDTAKNKPDFTLRLVASYAEASQWVRQHPQEAGVVASHWIEGIDPKVAAAALDNVNFDPRVTKITQLAWDLSNKLLIEDTKLKEPVPMQGHFDTSFLEKVMKDHPEYFSDLPAAESVSYK